MQTWAKHRRDELPTGGTIQPRRGSLASGDHIEAAPDGLPTLEECGTRRSDRTRSGGSHSRSDDQAPAGAHALPDAFSGRLAQRSTAREPFSFRAGVHQSVKAALVTGGLLMAGQGVASADIEPPAIEPITGSLECCPVVGSSAGAPEFNTSSEAAPQFAARDSNTEIDTDTDSKAFRSADEIGSGTDAPTAARPLAPVETDPAPLPRASDSPDLAVQQESRNTMTMPAADDAALPTYYEPRFSQHREIAEYWNLWADVNSARGKLSTETLDRLPAGPLFHGLQPVMTGQILTEPVQQSHVDANEVTTEFNISELTGRLHQAATTVSGIAPKPAPAHAAPEGGRGSGAVSSVLDAAVTAELPRISISTPAPRHLADEAERRLVETSESMLPDGSVLRLESLPREVVRASLSRGPLPIVPMAEDADPLAVWGEWLPGAGDLPRIPELTAIVRSAALSPASVLPEMGKLSGLGANLPLPVALPEPVSLPEPVALPEPVEDRTGLPASSGEVAAASNAGAKAEPRSDSDELPTAELSLPRWADADPTSLWLLPVLHAKSWGLPSPTDLPMFPELEDAFGQVSLTDPAVISVSLPTPTAAAEPVVTISDAAAQTWPTESDQLEASTDVDARQLDLGNLGGALSGPSPLDTIEFDALNDMNGLPLLSRGEAPALSMLDTVVLLRSVTEDLAKEELGARR
ncbi:hypothetical protein [Actinoalloteichus hymeniacidonis]|uniref:Uncharacterized protein n=1 Tax=Actinoalloteichus hymeniacidonis TaxID=340345 RepID=A0AAC9N1U4_9PSEU|nr:hypothetical protein [Actinoalloteichus hymeniacidonis]AOS66151.1 hypothetical protein TL08_26915 [Actinoalloteichus hymeniacidonis]MBB5905746.1 hypothetical protein [Actinoalloteichus hymeniacidonis]